jgi:hypothetical protein
LPILQALGWPVFDAQIVCPEYTVEGKRVDFALCHHPRRPEVFIEVKQVGQGEGADKQLFEYAFHEGVPMAILTTGQEWHFYVPAGQSLEAAREDYRSSARTREIHDTLPTAWRRLVEEQDDLLTELIGTKVEEICGYKPDPDTVALFLEEQARPDSRVPEPRIPTRRLPSSPVGPAPTPMVGGTRTGYLLQGQEFQARSAKGVLLSVLERLSARDPGFLERFAERHHGRTRRYVARTADELYLGRPDLARDHSHLLNSGWWVSTNHSKATITKILQMASEVAGLQFGTELIVYLG